MMLHGPEQATTCLRCERGPLVYPVWQGVPRYPMCAACIGAMYAMTAEELRAEGVRVPAVADVAALYVRERA